LTPIVLLLFNIRNSFAVLTQFDTKATKADAESNPPIANCKEFEMRFLANTIALTSLLALGGAANAQSINWNWSFTDTASGGTDSGSGILTTAALSGASYQVTAVDGTWDSATITGLIAAGGYAGNDNLLLSGATQLDVPGISFAVDGPAQQVNLAYITPGDGAVSTGYVVAATNLAGGCVYTNCVPTTSFGTFTATQAPEIDPTSAASGLALLVGGLLVLRGRKQQGVAA
jgi:hypothetical protein